MKEQPFTNNAKNTYLVTKAPCTIDHFSGLIYLRNNCSFNMSDRVIACATERARLFAVEG